MRRSHQDLLEDGHQPGRKSGSQPTENRSGNRSATCRFPEPEAGRDEEGETGNSTGPTKASRPDHGRGGFRRPALPGQPERYGLSGRHRSGLHRDLQQDDVAVGPDLRPEVLGEERGGRLPAARLQHPQRVHGLRPEDRIQV